MHRRGGGGGGGGEGPTQVWYRLDGGSAPRDSSGILAKAVLCIMAVAGGKARGASAP